MRDPPGGFVTIIYDKNVVLMIRLKVIGGLTDVLKILSVDGTRRTRLSNQLNMFLMFTSLPFSRGGSQIYVKCRHVLFTN